MVRAGEPSVTARRVAARRLGFDRVPADFGDAAADDRLAVDVAGDLAGVPPGTMSRYLAARTSFFDRVVVAAIDDGVDQIVIVGAGYDGRALRYARPGVSWFEVDHPDTQADKRGRLALSVSVAVADDEGRARRGRAAGLIVATPLPAA